MERNPTKERTPPEAPLLEVLEGATLLIVPAALCALVTLQEHGENSSSLQEAPDA